MNTRENNIDILRVFSALLVIILHCCSMYFVSNFATASTISVFTRVSVPIFVMISGRYLLTNYNNLSLGEFYKRKLPRILIPLVVWNIVYLLLNLALQPNYTIKKGVSDILLFGSSIHLWFFYLIFLLYLLTPLLNMIIGKLSKKGLIKFTIALLFLGFASELTRSITGFKNLPIYYPVEFIGFYLAGFSLKTYTPKFNKNYYLFGYIALALLGGGLCYYFQSVGNIFAFYFHTSANPLTLFASLSLYIYASNTTNVSKTSNASSKIGKLAKYSLGIYAIHLFILNSVMLYTNNTLTGLVFLDIFIYTLVTFVISLILSMGLYKLKITRFLVN